MLPSASEILSICAKHGLTLKPNVTLLEKDCCPLGALLVEKYGLSEATRLWLFSKNDSGSWAAKKLARLLDLDEMLTTGIIFGFDGSGAMLDNEGYKLGVACRAFAEKGA